MHKICGLIITKRNCVRSMITLYPVGTYTNYVLKVPITPEVS